MSKSKTSRNKKTDSVRTSRDGHEFHEAWVARKAMRLLLPGSNLAGMAVEGLSPCDEKFASSEAVQVADLTLYYGDYPAFANASRVEIVQFKYSVTHANIDLRMRHAKKTIKKFAQSYREFNELHDAKKVRDKLYFQLITNRPVFPALVEAITGLAEKRKLTGDAKEQAKQFKKASLLDDEQLAEFAGKCVVSGLAGNLGNIKKDLSKILVDWSATRDAIASARLGDMRQMVRDKAGSKGEGENVITRMDVLAALEIAEEEDLLPCPSRLPEVEKIVEREQLAEALALVPELSRPLLVHAAGGMGKTVFMRSLAEKLKDSHEVVFFDCFAGGAYRSPADSRHLPGMGLVHIVNTLACRGLCDPMLPKNQDLQSLLRTFRRRLEQSVGTLTKASHERKLLLLLDAIDNAEVGAEDRGEDCFPTLLLKSFRHDPPDGVKVIASSRSHRIPIGSAMYEDFELSAFSYKETKEYIRTRLPGASDVEIRVAQARSKGNPRILEHLVNSDRNLLDPSESNKEIELDELIRTRIKNALSKAALNQGYKQDDMDSFLAGLAVLPPPVPLEEYARSQGVEKSAAESFATDMRRWLERTEQGLMFRDEPTETLVREEYGSSEKSLKRIVYNLTRHQNRSVYATRALPELLYSLGDGHRLFNLAFDETFPEAVTGTVGKRNIRYARLKAAMRYAADQRNYGQLVGLLVEMSTVAGADQLGAEYILDYPDLVMAANDVDAVRRLFETRPPWPGTRHARLAIANALSGDEDEAYRHAKSTNEWINHWYSQPEEKRRFGPDRSRPELLDIAAIPFIQATEGNLQNAGKFMKWWKDWYSYEVWEHVLAFSHQAKLLKPGADLEDQLAGDIAGLTAALSFMEPGKTGSAKLICKLSAACGNVAELEFNTDEGLQRKRRYNFAEGLCKACGIALSLGSRQEASTVLNLVPKTRPGMWAFFRDRHSSSSQNIVLPDVILFLLQVALTAAAEGKELRGKDILPEDLMPFCESIKGDLEGMEFRNRLMEKINELAEREGGEPSSKNGAVTHERRREARQFIDTRLDPLLALVKALSSLLGAQEGKADGPFTDLLNAWMEAEETSEPYGAENFSRFFQVLGFQIATFALWTRGDLKELSVKAYIKRLNSRELVGTSMLIEAVGILAKRPLLQALAGEEALKACSPIEGEDDVLDRTYFYADLARAILPASIEEAAQYFRKGLEETDAVGNERDYGFVNEMLIFASSFEGKELEEKDFHNLTNICELNIPDEPEKFFWTAFGEGLSRVAGCRGLAKLLRWDDRSKAPVSCTLQPYLTALIRDGKIDPEDALSLNRLAYPSDYSGTGKLAKVVKESSHENTEELVSEVIRQFKENRQGTLMYGSTDALTAVAESVLGAKSKLADYLARSHRHFEQVFHAQDEHGNYRGERGEHLSGQHIETQRQKEEIAEIISRAEAADIQSLEKAIDDLTRIGNFHDFHEEFFNKIREKMPYEKQTDYVRVLAGHETLNFYRKLDELEKCKDSWEKSSLSLADTYKEIGVPTLLQHMEDIVSHGQIREGGLNRISEISRIPIHDLVLELVKKFAGREARTTREVWISLARLVCGKAREQERREALTRLLNGPVTKLSHKASDGEWKEYLYPENSDDIFSGMVWRMLGSPNPEYRWRAAHSVRCFARFKRWHILDALMDKMSRKDAGTFQASEWPFYYLHAKLWLLIALARVALDEPKAGSKYKDILLKIALDEENPHVLMTHFAAEAIRACARAGETELPDGLEKSLAPINKKKTVLNANDFHDRKQEPVPRPESEFFLGRRFYEHDVRSLGRMFGKDGREVREMMSEIVRSIDPEIKSKNDSAKKTGKQPSYMIDGTAHMSFDTYGQQLGWHALFMAAGQFLREYPVTDDRGYDDPWNKWLRPFLLTRKDGLWVSDGMDRVPLDALQTLLEKSERGLVLTGDRSKILKLANLESGIQEEVVIAGEWSSADRITVHIESALVRPAKVRMVVKQLFEEDPQMAWLPNYCGTGDEEEYPGSDKDNCEPWIVWPGGDPKLDKDDPLGAVAAIRRLRIARNFSSELSLKREDPFGRVWKNGRIMARGVAWGHEIKGDYEKPGMGTRLACSRELLKSLLSQSGSDLLLLIKLLRYEKVYSHEPDIHANKAVVVHISQTLDVESWDSRP